MINFVKGFEKFIKIHREIEKRIILKINSLFPNINCISDSELDNKKYFSKNYLSILFIVIYDFIKIPKKEIIFLGTLNYLIRGLVTSTDNILDDEDKYLFFSKKIDPSSNVPQSILGLMLMQFMFEHYLDEATKDEIINKEVKSEIQKKIYTTLFVIGIVEAQEDGADDTSLSPGEVLEKVNFYRGSKLLELAFIPLNIIHKDKKNKINIDGVHSIGMGLQILDDISDISIDLTTNKRNFLSSVIMFKYQIDSECLLKELRSNNFFDKYEDEILDCFKKAIANIKRGIEQIQKERILFKKEAFKKLIEFMLINRKMESYIHMLDKV